VINEQRVCGTCDGDNEDAQCGGMYRTNEPRGNINFCLADELLYNCALDYQPKPPTMYDDMASESHAQAHLAQNQKFQIHADVIIDPSYAPAIVCYE
jgi:hypothetical protein